MKAWMFLFGVALAVKNKLRGYHYLASPAVQESLKPVVPYIPRYMLFDRTGALVEPNAYHPSDGEKLYRQLRERLGVKQRGLCESALQLPSPHAFLPCRAAPPRGRFRAPARRRPRRKIPGPDVSARFL